MLLGLAKLQPSTRTTNSYAYCHCSRGLRSKLPRARTFFGARQSFLDRAGTSRDYLEECLSTNEELEPVVQA